MAETTSDENRNSTWDGTSGQGMKAAVLQPPLEGDESPEIRGTTASPLNSEELSKVWRSSPTIPDRRQWPMGGSPGVQEDVQADE